jgi:hypothetical protein
VSFFVERVVDLTARLTVELRVSHQTAALWVPRYEGEQRAPGTCAGRALLEAHEMLRSLDITTGRWRFTWNAARVEVEPA